MGHNKVSLICPFNFHRSRLVQDHDKLEQIFEKRVRIFESEYDYIQADAVIQFAINELGAEVHLWKT
jgi:hypothetical protein